MRRKNFVGAVAAVAVLGVFNPAFAQDSRDLTVNANPNVGSGDQSVSSSVSANQSSTDTGSSSTMNQSTASGQASGSTSAQASTDRTQSGASAEGSARGEASSDHRGRGHARGHDEDRAKGLDRADQVAGDHGKHGRDNAREKQSLN